MSTWRTPNLHVQDQILLREDLAVEFAPGRVAALDLAAMPALRAGLVCPLLPRGSTPATLTAAWIHTGWWPQRRLVRLCAAHPSHSHHPIVQRCALPDSSSVVLAGHRIPSPARTAFDLLTLESPDVAIEGTLHLLATCLTIDQLREQCAVEKGRRGRSFARACVDALAHYIRQRDGADAPPADRESR
ncbi:MAG: hypothetical protein Q3979_07865 [Actinomycetaceae bacterium]|nr:hypothetical protein [Actinomycetaceae bacterium]